MRRMPYLVKGEFTALVSVFQGGAPMSTIFVDSCTRRCRGSARQHEPEEERVEGVMLGACC